MSEHRVKVRWKNEKDDFSYKAYDRTHLVQFDSGKSFTGSAAPEYMGDEKHINPEEELGAALSSCHMMTFLFVASKRKKVVASYEDDGYAVLEKNEAGKMAVTKMILRPKVVFKDGVEVSKEELVEMHNKAHDGCFIANSVLTKIIIEPIFNATFK